MNIIEIVIIFLGAVIPPIIYLVWVRNTEVCRREPFTAVLFAFIFGGTVAVGAAYILESALIELMLTEGNFFWEFIQESPGLLTVFIAVVIAPLVEETVKAGGVFAFRGRLGELENGLIYGASVGLGFAAVENILYLGSAMAIGVEVFVVTAVVRALTSTVLHASATGVAGYGITRSHLLRRQGIESSWLLYLLAGMLLHGVFNLFAILGVLYTADSDTAYMVGLFLGAFLALYTFGFVRRKIRELDRYGCIP